VTSSRIPLTEGKYIAPLAMITSLFFLWALGVNLNDVLIPHLKKAFKLTDLQSSLIQTAFFGGYFLAALPAGRLMGRIGYKKGILTGLLMCATGALLFIPAAIMLAYGFFLFALFVMACGQSFLEVAANPYVTMLGPPESAERRLNLAQSFNSVGAVITPVIGAAFILTNTRSDMAQAEEANTVKLPYLVIAMIFVSVAIMIYFTRLPEVKESQGIGRQSLAEVWKFSHLRQGVLAQFFYVGAQVGVASFVIRLAEQARPGTSDQVAARYLQLHLLGFMIGRFAGSGIMKYVAASKLLAIFAAGALLCGLIAVGAPGSWPIYAVIAIGFFHSIMFPTIFALSIKGLGAYTKLGSSLLVMAIVGGAALPAAMGYISDRSNIQRALIIPLFCYVYILNFAHAARGHDETLWLDSRSEGRS
jgi:FHS family L-fucose permease-like MFS transporter